jgi:hypothetical protein
LTRQNFSKRILAERFAFAGGRCEWVEPETKIRCNTVLIPGRWNGDHCNPDGLTGQPTFENCRALCLDHHKLKTADDVARIAKAKRLEAAHVGAEPEPERPTGFRPKKTREEFKDPFPGLPRPGIYRRFK